MSKFTGKEPCFYSEFYGYSNSKGDDTEWEKQTFKIYNSKTNKDEDLKITNTKEAVPYFAHMIGAMGWNNGVGYYRLSENPYFVTEEREHLNYELDAVKRYYRRCKRTKTEFNREECLNHICFIESYKSDPVFQQIIDRVLEHPTSANIDDLHYDKSHMWQHYRRYLYEEMLKYGYTEEEAQKWVYEGIKIWD